MNNKTFFAMLRHEREAENERSIKTVSTDGTSFDPLLVIQDIVDSPAVYLYLKELVHPMPQMKLNKSRPQTFPDDYYAIFIAGKELTSKKELVDPHSIKLWSTMELAETCGNDKRLAIDTCAMIATMLTFSGNEVYVNNELFSPEKIRPEKVDQYV